MTFAIPESCWLSASWFDAGVRHRRRCQQERKVVDTVRSVAPKRKAYVNALKLDRPASHAWRAPGRAHAGRTRENWVLVTRRISWFRFASTVSTHTWCIASHAIDTGAVSVSPYGISMQHLFIIIKNCCLQTWKAVH